jgi:hypothetical protein
VASTPTQRIWRDRFEAVIGIAAPGLDLILNVGGRASRLLAGEEGDYYPIRPAAEALELDEARGNSPRRPFETGD